MTTLRRLGVWSIETSCEVLLLVLLMILSGRSEQRTLAEDLSLAFFGTAIVFMVGSGYLLTTGIFGVVWRSPIPWVYPVIAATLFILHVQFFADGGDASTKVPVQAGGACIVFACTLAGNWFLRRWTASQSLTN